MKKIVFKDRRTVLKLSAVGVAATLATWASAQVEGGDVPATKPATQGAIVQVGDLLVFQSGTNANKPIKSSDIKEGDLLLAYAMDPKTKALRDKSKGNIVLVKLPMSTLSDDTKANAATDSVDGVVAYSAVCTHQGCAVSQIASLGSSKGKLQCPCHQSLYDPADNAKVVGGPAPRRLPALPIKAVSGQLSVAGDFKGRVGVGK